MTADEARITTAKYQLHCEALFEVAKTALRNRQSLSGSNFYGNKFHDAILEVAKTEIAFRKILDSCHLDNATRLAFDDCVSKLKSTDASLVHRSDAVKGLQLICQSVLIPEIENMNADPVPVTEQVLPLSVVRSTRGYFEKIITQANGCFEHQWYDACAVMIRRFTETLIIEVYEHLNRASEIKDRNGEFFAMRDLIQFVTNDASINLGRDTKKSFPLLKELGDRSAHNRRYLATKSDVDKVLPGLRVMADEMLHLAGLK